MLKLKSPLTLFVLIALFVVGCTSKPISDSGPITVQGNSIDIGGLSFRTPSEGDWFKKTDRSPNEEAVILIKGEATAEDRSFIINVSQMQVHNPILSVEALMNDMIIPFRDVVNFDDMFEIQTLECEEDKTFSSIGVLCFVEAIDNGFIHQFKPNAPKGPITISGHSRVFVHPKDNRLVSVVEYGQQVIPGKSLIDTAKMLDELNLEIHQD